MKSRLLLLLIFPLACQVGDSNPGNHTWVHSSDRGKGHQQLDENGNPLPFVCVGVEVPEAAYNRAPGPVTPVEEEETTSGDDSSAEVDGADSGEVPNGDDGADGADGADGIDGDDDLPTEPVPAGPEPEDEEEETVEDPCETGLATCVGSPAPVWALTDFQPQSCGYGATYGMEPFKGRVTLLVLLAAW